MNFVPIIMGSKSDLKHGEAIKDALSKFDIESEIRVASAHKAPRFLLGELERYEGDGRNKVYVTIAGRSNALSALVDGQVSAPVVSCPPYSDKFGGGDLFSSLRMPSGITPLVILDPAGAALAAVKILSLGDSALKKKVSDFQKGLAVGIESDDGSLRESNKS